MDIYPLLISLKVSLIATVFVVIFGVIMAYFTTKSRFSTIFDMIFTLPIILPPTVIGFFLLMIFGKNGVIGKVLEMFGISLVFTVEGAILSAFIVAFPLMYRTVKGAIHQIDKDILSAANSLGISEFKIFTKILIPYIKPGIIAGAVLSFARALGEFGATMMFAGNIPKKTQTVSIKIYTAVQAGDINEAFFWVFVIMSISILCLFVLNIFEKKQRRR